MQLSSLNRSISPPPAKRQKNGDPSTPDKKSTFIRSSNNFTGSTPSLAALEAGQILIPNNHLSYITSRLHSLSRPSPSSFPRIPFSDFIGLYERNQSDEGRHFVIHQHDHPVSGVHYDLRLQFEKGSSVSWALPYGVPGNAGSRRGRRMGVETRVHCVWNHLIETASNATGSLLIWDTGEYEVLPRANPSRAAETDDELSDGDDLPSEAEDRRPEPLKLVEAFRSVSALSRNYYLLNRDRKQRHIRLRLRGMKLPKNYTINMRLPSANAQVTPKRPRFSRKRGRIARSDTKTPAEFSTDDENAHGVASGEEDGSGDDDAAGMASDGSGDEDEQIRTNNAYPGATNSIGSVHQRHWLITLDHLASGFVRNRKGTPGERWKRGTSLERGEQGALVEELGGWEPFYVRGRDEERSVVTGRLAKEIMDDEGVKNYAGRKMWRPILE
ncbi:MAG: hypothetical protein M1820_006374 [Bogoriella megaspora]|nr:MAG: hypothetical protein M1820_006374 [Bogoriella megaspora]